MINCFVYWEGPRPRHIEICLTSLRHICTGRCQFTLITPDNVREFIPDGVIHPRAQQLEKPAQRADCIRAALLALHGGFYFDADTIGIRNPEELATDHELVYMVWDKAPRRVLNGYVYARPGSRLAARWLQGINERLADPERLIWAALGEGILTPLVDEAAQQDPDSVRQIPRDTFLPIDIDSHVGLFFKPGDPQKLVKPHTVCFGLNHSWFMHYQPRQMLKSAKQMRTSTLLIHRLLTLASLRNGQ